MHSESLVLISTLLVVLLLLTVIFIVLIMTVFVVYRKGMDNDYNNNHELELIFTDDIYNYIQCTMEKL